MPKRIKTHDSRIKKPGRKHRRLITDKAQAEAIRIRNSGRWNRYRHWFRDRYPVCEDPFDDHGKTVVLMKQVHHIIPLVMRPDLACVESNTASLCTMCHAKIERMERNGTNTQQYFPR